MRSLSAIGAENRGEYLGIILRDIWAILMQMVSSLLDYSFERSARKADATSPCKLLFLNHHTQNLYFILNHS